MPQPQYQDLDALLRGAKDALARANALSADTNADAARMPATPRYDTDFGSELMHGITEHPKETLSGFLQGAKDPALRVGTRLGRNALGLAQTVLTPPSEQAKQYADPLADLVMGKGARPSVGGAVKAVTGVNPSDDYPEMAADALTAVLFGKLMGAGQQVFGRAPEATGAVEPRFGPSANHPDVVRLPQNEAPIPVSRTPVGRPERFAPNRSGSGYEGDPTAVADPIPPPSAAAATPRQMADATSVDLPFDAAPVQESPAFSSNEQPQTLNTKPHITAPELAAILKGREKFTAANPDATFAPGMRDELDRSGLEYGRTQNELKRLLGMPDADPAEVSRMQQGARELGSRLRKTAKAAITLPQDAGPTPAVLEPSVAADAPVLPEGRSGHFTLPKPRALLNDAELDATRARVDPVFAAERRQSSAARADGPDRRASSLGGEPIAPADLSPAFQREFGPVEEPSILSRLLSEEEGSLDRSRLQITPEQQSKIGNAMQAHQAGSLLFNPLTLARILVSNASSAVAKALEHSATEGSFAPMGRTLKELLNVKQMGRDAVDAFNNPHTKYSRDSEPYPSGGAFGLGSRAVGAVDAPFRKAMERAGFPEEDALTVTQQRAPLTDFGKSTVNWQQKTRAARLLVPFLKAKMNEFETGLVEPVQAAGRLVRGDGTAADAVKTGLAVGAGAAGYAGSDHLDTLPGPLRSLLMASAGLYGAPMAVGYGAGHLGRGGRGAYEALIKALPLAEGFSTDPTTQMNRVVPRTLNPDYWTGTKRDTPTFLDKIQAQIPGLAQLLNPKRTPAPRRDPFLDE